MQVGKPEGLGRKPKSKAYSFHEKSKNHIYGNKCYKGLLSSLHLCCRSPKNGIISLRYKSKLFKTVFLGYMNLLCHCVSSVLSRQKHTRYSLQAWRKMLSKFHSLPTASVASTSCSFQV